MAMLLIMMTVLVTDGGLRHLLGPPGSGGEWDSMMTMLMAAFASSLALLLLTLTASLGVKRKSKAQAKAVSGRRPIDLSRCRYHTEGCVV